MPYNSAILCPQCGADVTRTLRNECPRCDFREIIAPPPDEQTTLAALAESIMNEQPPEGRGGGGGGSYVTLRHSLGPNDDIWDRDYSFGAEITNRTNELLERINNLEQTRTVGERASGELRWLRRPNRTELVLQQKWVTTEYRSGAAPFIVTETWRDVPTVDE